MERFLKTKKQLKKSGWKEGFAYLSSFPFVTLSFFLLFTPFFYFFFRRDPQLPKTIDPVSLGGVAGGDKYIVNNIVFKFAGFVFVFAFVFVMALSAEIIIFYNNNSRFPWYLWGRSLGSQSSRTRTSWIRCLFQCKHPWDVSPFDCFG